MQARIVGAARGAHWMAEGWRMFRAAPFGWIVAVLAYWLLMSILSIVPLVGVALAALLVPAFSVGFMALARASARGGRRAPLDPRLLLEGFRHEPRAQLALGAVYLACLVLLLGASALADDGALAQWMLTGRRPPDEALQSEAFLMALAAACALYAPVMLAFWFAPPLASWHGTGAAKALFFSFAASLMNWRAFLAYGAVAAALTLVLPMLIITVLSLAGGGSMQLPAAALMFPLLVLMLPVFFASFYASYRDVFGYDAAP
jgi:hypothetical protein